MADTNSDYVNQIFDLAQAFAVPYVKQLAGTDKQSAQTQADATMQEIANNARLNGSGPNDPSLAVQSAPTSIFDFINGKSAGSTKVQGGNLMFYLIVGGLIFIGVLMLRKS